jgi:hypothetical protein
MFRRPFWLAVLVLLALCLTARAQNESIWLALSPAPAPKPSLKYRLLPDRRELIPGNAAAIYYRGMAFFVENQGLLMEIKEQHWDKWLAMPVDELPRDEVRGKLGAARNLLREFEVGARRRDCDWSLDHRTEGIFLLIPEVQGMRRIGTLLAVRAKLAMAEGHLDEALATLQVGFALGRHLGEGPTFIHVLVGVAIASIMTNQLEEFLQRPGAPNLYWSLAVIPRPFSNLKNAWEMETNWLEQMFPVVKRLEDGPMSLGQVKRMDEEMDHIADRVGLRAPDAGERIARGVQQALAYPEAKRGLLEQGMKAEEIQAMPPYQVVALFAWREYRRTWDEAAKYAQTPEGFRHASYKPATIEHLRAMQRLDRVIFCGRLSGFGLGFPAVEKVYNAVGRLERRFEALRTIEAIRLYAAAHGKLPASLTDITEVPVPSDPVSRQPFEYIVRGDRASFNSKLPEKENIDKGVVYLLHLRR